jgi:hypothetical protein
MAGIDTGMAGLLTSRLDTLIDSVGAGSRTTAAQTGTSALSVDTPSSSPAPAALADALPPASAQTQLSEVALTLDAISRFGGEATPVVVGELPIWPAPPAIDTSASNAASSAPGTAGSAANPTANGTSFAAGASADGAAAATGAAEATGAAMLPVAALAAALEQTVGGSGLFYESHLAQWLSGGYPAEALAEEPQTKLAAQAAQLPLGWEEPEAAPGAGGTWSPAGQASYASAPSAPHAGDARLLATAIVSQLRGAVGELHANNSESVRASLGLLAGDGSDMPDAVRANAANAATAGAASSVAASIHPATIPLVRQQLDLLATEQFRWSGEVWPGTKLDWTIEPERGRGGRQNEADGADDEAWRTRVTLALPTLGTVDADLVLSGTQLVVRIQAGPGGAARLSSTGASFGRSLQAAGIELAGLTIREVGASAPQAAGAAHAAASAYARTAAVEVSDAQVHEVPADAAAPAGPVPSGNASGPAAGTSPAAKRAGKAGKHSPLDRLFDDPFEWSDS